MLKSPRARAAWRAVSRRRRPPRPHRGASHRPAPRAVMGGLNAAARARARHKAEPTPPAGTPAGSYRSYMLLCSMYKCTHSSTTRGFSSFICFFLLASFICSEYKRCHFSFSFFRLVRPFSLAALALAAAGGSLLRISLRSSLVGTAFLLLVDARSSLALSALDFLRRSCALCCLLIFPWLAGCCCLLIHDFKIHLCQCSHADGCFLLSSRAPPHAVAAFPAAVGSAISWASYISKSPPSKCLPSIQALVWAMAGRS